MTSTKPTSSPSWHSAVSGCVAGAGARLVVAPLDLIRIRLQVEPHKSLAYHVRNVATESGFFGFFRGNVPATWLWMGYSAIQFSVYARVSEILQDDQRVGKSVTAFVSGATAGVTATLLTYPLDICRTSFAARATVEAPRTMWEFTLEMYHKQGLRGFFAGAGPALYGIVPYMGFNFLIYETLVGDNKTTVNAGMAGAIAGGVSKLLVYPLDTIKKRIQVEAFYEGQKGVSMVNCVVRIVKHEGAMSLYRGMLPSVLKNTIATSLAFSIYTLTQNVLQSIDLQRNRNRVAPSGSLPAKTSRRNSMSPADNAGE